MFYGQGRKPVKPIIRYRKYYNLHHMQEIVLYEHSVAYIRCYTYVGSRTYVVSQRISMKLFNFFLDNGKWNMFN